MILSDSYIAGFFDGEGCITSQLVWKTGKYEKHPRVNVQVTITQKDRKILEGIQKKFGGTIQYKFGGPKYAKRNPCYHLRITGKETMGNFLRTIQPYSIVKREQIDLALEFIEGLRDENLGCVALPKAVHDTRERIHNQLRVLK